jgi:Cu-processing system ATP-binding protein
LPALDPKARRALSFLPQRVSFPDSLTGREVVEF